MRDKRLTAKALRNSQWRKNSYAHAKRRLKQRYGIDLDQKTFERIIKDVKDNLGYLTITKRPGTRILKYRLGEKIIYIAYSDILKSIKTFLPPEGCYNQVWLVSWQEKLLLENKLTSFYKIANSEKYWLIDEPFHLKSLKSDKLLAKAKVVNIEEISRTDIMKSDDLKMFGSEFELIKFLKINHFDRFDKEDTIRKITFEIIEWKH